MSVSGFDRDFPVRPGARPLYARPTGNLAAAMIGVVAVTVLGVAAVFFKPPPPIVASADNGGRNDSGDIARAPSPAPTAKQNAVFDLTAPEFAKETKVLSSRRLEGGDGREDSLTLGEFTPGGPYLRLDFRETPADKRGNPDFFLDMTRHATQAGLTVVKISQLSPLASRFGSFETAEIRLSQKTSGESAATERACLALRLIGGKRSVEIAGVACGAPAKPIDRRALGCILDRLDYLPNGENAAFEQFFLAAAQERGKGCGAAGAAISPNAEKNSWLDAHSVPPALKTEPAPPKHTKKAR
ncbi:MAG: hypothetical protein WBQ53_11465 [Methylocystis sp.]